MNFFNSVDVGTIDTHISTNIYGGLKSQGEGIDLRLEMNYLLYGNSNRSAKGHWIVLRKYDRSKKSEHYNNCTKEGVGGPAYQYTDYLIRTRRVPSSFKGNPFEPIKAGISLEDKYIYYLEYTVKPKRGDHIIELKIDDHTKRPTITKSILDDRYIIKGIHPYRLENGNVQYYSVNVEIDEIRY